MAALGREPARPLAIAAYHHAPWLATGAVCVGAFMGQLDASIASLALPAISRDFHAGLQVVQWVALAYLLTLVAFVAPVGRWSDTHGRKLFYLYGFVVFTTGSAACALAPSLPLLIVARVLQAVGAAMMQANSVALIRTSVPAANLRLALGVQAGAQAVGLALGPTVGGLLLAVGSWRLLFAVNLPAGLVGLLAGWVFLPRTRHRRPATRFDAFGLALFVPGVSAATWALSTLGRSPLQAGLAATIGAALLVWFVRHARATPNPLLDLALIRTVGLGFPLGAGLLAFAALFGVLFATPLYLHASSRLSVAAIGLLLTALPAGLALTAPLAGVLGRRLPPRPLATTSLVLATAVVLALATAPRSLVVTAALIGLLGCAVGVFTPVNNHALMRSVAADRAGVVSGMLNMARAVGTVLGVSVATAGMATAEEPGAARHAFAVTMIVLTAFTAAAAGLSWMRPRTAAQPPGATT
jgi:EmrB/QacA subfamily drug resistance transporter